ncbi:MAG: DUF1647 domain-containing protein [Patescibacteria group bacterium]|nr:DUF1647 domain-containing protein [Patescibacteria group bacterium]
MMKKNRGLISKLGKGVLISGLALTLIGNDDAACTPEEKMILGEMIAEGAAKEDDKFGEYTGKRLYLEGERERAEAIARAGADRTNVNVYVGENETRGESRGNILENVIYSDGTYSPAPGYTWLNSTAGDFRVRKVFKEDVKFFACNYWKDFNNNNAGDYPEEFVGIKNKFRDDERIILVSYDQLNMRGTEMEIKIFNPRGKEIYSRVDIYDSNGVVNRTGTEDDMMGWLIDNGGYGNFKSVWYVNDNYAGSTEFEIIPGSRDKKTEKPIFIEDEMIFEEEFIMLEPELFLDEDFYYIEDSTTQKP